jgi:hypothetical protein
VTNDCRISVNVSYCMHFSVFSVKQRVTYHFRVSVDRKVGFLNRDLKDDKVFFQILFLTANCFIASQTKAQKKKKIHEFACLKLQSL